MHLALPAQQSDLQGPPSHPEPHNGALVPPGTTSGPIVVNCRAGLHHVDGELWGGATTYKVCFGAHGFEFTPAFGPSAPRNYPLRFELDSIGRDGAEVAPAAATPRPDGLRVEYDRGVAVERYDLGPDAMEQSFVFAKRPAGRGDLIVRGRLRTDLRVAPDAGGLRFEEPGIGSFRMGRVTGIDAGGVRADGEVRYADGTVELVLPAAFVDRAALPFVLDPTFGSSSVVSVPASSADTSPQAAFDATNNCYLVIWANRVSATDADVHGQRVSATGVLLGSRLLIWNSTASESEPSVANVNVSNAFVVVAARGSDIVGRAVTAAAGSLMPGTVIVGGADRQTSPSIGGDVRVGLSLTGNATCTWVNSTANALQACGIAVNPDLSLSPSATVNTFAVGTQPNRPRISKSGGATGRHAIVFGAILGVLGQSQPWGLVVDAAGTPLAPLVPLDAATSVPFARIEVDGDGTHWVAAYEADANVSGGVLTRRAALSFVPGLGQLLNMAGNTRSVPGRSLIAPSVAWTGGSAVVPHIQMDFVSSSGVAGVDSIEPSRCSDCEGIQALNAITSTSTTAACATSSAGGSPDEALLLYGVDRNNGDIVAQLWRSEDGAVTNLGGGCGAGGQAHASCVRVGNWRFAHQLRGAAPGAGALLLQSFGQESDACGPCRRIPALSGAVAQFAVVDSIGAADIAAGIRNVATLRGLQIVEQWLVLSPAPRCASFGIDMSNALRLVIE
jgi:hypothetical protein